MRWTHRRPCLLGVGPRLNTGAQRRLPRHGRTHRVVRPVIRACVAVRRSRSSGSTGRCGSRQACVVRTSRPQGVYGFVQVARGTEEVGPQARNPSESKRFGLSRATDAASMPCEACSACFNAASFACVPGRQLQFEDASLEIAADLRACVSDWGGVSTRSPQTQGGRPMKCSLFLENGHSFAPHLCNHILAPSRVAGRARRSASCVHVHICLPICALQCSVPRVVCSMQLVCSHQASSTLSAMALPFLLVRPTSAQWSTSDERLVPRTVYAATAS